MQIFAEIFTLLEKHPLKIPQVPVQCLSVKSIDCLRALRIFENKTAHQFLDLDPQFQMDLQCLDVY